MFNVSSYLEKFKGLYAENLYFKDSVVRIIKEKTGITIDKSAIKVSKSVLTINTKPIFKSEIFLKKGEIQRELSSLFPQKVSDIR